MKTLYSVLLCLVTLVPAQVLAQGNQNDVRLFQNFFQDGSHVGQFYGETALTFSDFDSFNLINIGGRIGFPIGMNFEGGLELSYLSFDPNVGDNVSGLSDLSITGRYRVSSTPTDISIGGSLTLPIGDEDVGQGDVDLGIFGAIRHPASNQLSIAGVLGIDFIEQGDDYEASLNLGGGVIYRTQPDLSLIGELSFQTEFDYALLSFGVDYILSGGSHLRPAVGLGVDNGAPDFVLLFGILFK